MFARAAETFRRVGDASNAANADYNRADVLVRQGRSDEALPLLQNTLRVARAVGDEDLVALVRKEMGRAQSRAGDVAAGLILLEEARAQLIRLREPQEVVDADIAAAEAHLLAGRPEQALALIEGALAEAASIHAATLLPSAYRVQAAALLAMGEVAQARTALAEGLRQSSSPDVAHERGFLLAVAAGSHVRTMIPTQTGLPNRRAKPWSCWVSFGCRCLSSVSQELGEAASRSP